MVKKFTIALIVNMFLTLIYMVIDYITWTSLNAVEFVRCYWKIFYIDFYTKVPYGTYVTGGGGSFFNMNLLWFIITVLANLIIMKKLK